MLLSASSCRCLSLSVSAYTYSTAQRCIAFTLATCTHVRSACCRSASHELFYAICPISETVTAMFACRTLQSSCLCVGTVLEQLHHVVQLADSGVDQHHGPSSVS
eukprot:20682-Heterococcus_DN1.PRE.1